MPDNRKSSADYLMQNEAEIFDKLDCKDVQLAESLQIDPLIFSKLCEQTKDWVLRMENAYVVHRMGYSVCAFESNNMEMKA